MLSIGYESRLRALCDKFPFISRHTHLRNFNYLYKLFQPKAVRTFAKYGKSYYENCYGIDFRSWRKELRTREKTKQPPCKLPDRVSRSLQGVLFKVYQISVLILLKKILFSFFSVCLPLFIRHIAAMLLRKHPQRQCRQLLNI